ncbi:MAG TPA: DUF1254 domain-containing protein [Anaeromyxobacteraceae bacterium]|nr:DUF1254 domain-containing protein [Anaeromyxobacteraceae bacterium]
MKAILNTALLASLLFGSTASAQQLATPATPKTKFSTEMPPGVAMPDTVKSRLGKLRFQDGFPDAATTKQLYDNLDFQRALQGLPARATRREPGGEPERDPHDGPGQQDRPHLGADGGRPHGRTNCEQQHALHVVLARPARGAARSRSAAQGARAPERHVVPLGRRPGPHREDRGQGGKYLLLPPGYKGAVPDGYFVLRPATLSVWAGWRSFLVEGDPKPGVDAVKKFTKFYLLSQAANPSTPTFVDMPGKPFNMVGRADYPFWEALNQVVQDEPTDTVDATTLGLHRHPAGQALRP